MNLISRAKNRTRGLLLVRLITLLFIFPCFALSQEGGVCVDCGLGFKPPMESSKYSSLGEVATKASESFNALTFLSAEMIEKTDSRLLGKLIVDRLNANCDTVRDPSSIKPNETDSQIIMLVPDRNIDSIIKYGFKNQHQTGSTGGCNCKKSRLNAETNHVGLGLPYSNKARELLPKYALQVFKTDKMGTNPAPFSYGNVMVRFKPEVKARSTWSSRDSLDIEENLRTNKIRAPKNTKCYSYCEAQIWGALDFSDAESIVLPEGFAVTEEMKKIGLPIYTYKNLAYASTVPSTPEAPTTSIRVSFSEKPIFEPVGTAVSVPKDLSVENLTKERDGEAHPVKRGIIDAARIGKLSTDQLVSEFKEANTASAGKPPIYGSELGTNETRLLAELAGRPKTSASKSLLLEQLKSSDSNAKAMALGAFSTSDWKELKPLLIEALKAPGASTPSFYGEKNLYKLVAQRIAFSHLNDEDIVEAFKVNPADAEALSFFRNKKTCQKETYE